jgi:CheY-like chemotaxis protein
VIPPFLSVLLVDDEGVYISLLAEQLRTEHNFRTAVAFSGNEAIKTIQRANKPFDVILLDYKMPDLSGLNVMQWMYEHKLETPVIMLTAVGSESIGVEAMKLGAYDYLTKETLDLQRLAIAISSVHDRHLFRKRKELEAQQAMEKQTTVSAAESARKMLEGIAPMANNSLAKLQADFEKRAEGIINAVPDQQREEFETFLKVFREEIAVLQKGLAGILTLSKIIYSQSDGLANTPENLKEIEKIKTQWEKKPNDIPV